MKALGFLMALMFAVAITGCQSDDADGPADSGQDTKNRSEAVADEQAEEVERDEMGAELLTKAQLEARGLAWIDFTEETCHDEILGSDEDIEIPASGGTVIVELKSAANIQSMICGDSKDAIMAQYTGSYANLDYKIIESETAVMNRPVVDGPWCKDYYVLVVQPFPTDDFNGLTATFTDHLDLSISLAANPEAEERWYRIELARNMYQPDMIVGVHWYFGSYDVFFVHQPAGKPGGVVDVRI